MTDVFQRSATLRRSRALKAIALSPAVLLFASATRLLLISDYDTTTATTIATNGGIVGTLLGTVVPLLPPYLPIITILLVATRQWALAVFAGCATVLLSPAYVDSPRDGWDEALALAGRAAELTQQQEWSRIWQESPGVALSAGTGIFLVLLIPPTRVALSLAYSLDNWLVRAFSRVVYCIFVAAICTYATLLVQTFYRVPFNADVVSEIARRPWIPAEQIVLKSSGLPLVGYTLSAATNWHVILNESDRKIIYVHTDDIATRTSCRPSSIYIEQPRLPLLPLRNLHRKTTENCTMVP